MRNKKRRRDASKKLERPPAWDRVEREEEKVDEPKREKAEDTEDVRKRQTERQENTKRKNIESEFLCLHTLCLQCTLRVMVDNKMWHKKLPAANNTITSPCITEHDQCPIVAEYTGIVVNTII